MKGGAQTPPRGGGLHLEFPCLAGDRVPSGPAADAQKTLAPWLDEFLPPDLARVVPTVVSGQTAREKTVFATNWGATGQRRWTGQLVAPSRRERGPDGRS